MSYQMIRPISEGAVQAIMAARALWQFSQNTYSIAVSDGKSMSTGVPVDTTAFDYAEVTPNAASDSELLESMRIALESANEILERMQFEELASEWEKTKYKWSSRAGGMAQDPNYLRIVGMGPAAVPHILNRMKNELASGGPDHWFVALWSITGENPIQPEHRGVLRKMALDWINWGIGAGLIDGSGLGE